MEKEKRNFRKELIYLVITIIAFFSVVIYVNKPEFAHYGFGKKLYKVVEIDSLKSENAALRQALAAKLESHCDTMTVDQKLAQQKFNDYAFKMYKIKEAQEFKAYNLKQSQEFKAYNEMDHEKVQVIFTNYWELRCRALVEVEKANSTIFKEYAVAMYKHDNLGYSDYKAEQDLSEKIKMLEKNPLVANYLSKEKAADKIKTQKDSENEKKYQSKIAEIKKNYQTQLAVIEKNYNQKIAAKKIELGL